MSTVTELNARAVALLVERNETTDNFDRWLELDEQAADLFAQIKALKAAAEPPPPKPKKPRTTKRDDVETFEWMAEHTGAIDFLAQRLLGCPPNPWQRVQVARMVAATRNLTGVWADEQFLAGLRRGEGEEPYPKRHAVLEAIPGFDKTIRADLEAAAAFVGEGVVMWRTIGPYLELCRTLEQPLEEVTEALQYINQGGGNVFVIRDGREVPVPGFRWHQ